MMKKNANRVLILVFCGGVWMTSCTGSHSRQVDTSLYCSSNRDYLVYDLSNFDPANADQVAEKAKYKASELLAPYDLYLEAVEEQTKDKDVSQQLKDIFSFIDEGLLNGETPEKIFQFIYEDKNITAGLSQDEQNFLKAIQNKMAMALAPGHYEFSGAFFYARKKGEPSEIVNPQNPWIRYYVQDVKKPNSDEYDLKTQCLSNIPVNKVGPSFAVEGFTDFQLVDNKKLVSLNVDRMSFSMKPNAFVPKLEKNVVAAPKPPNEMLDGLKKAFYVVKDKSGYNFELRTQQTIDGYTVDMAYRFQYISNADYAKREAEKEKANKAKDQPSNP